MKCLCPKCSSNIELDLNEIPEDGSFNKCPQCSTGFLVKKVSFASRALHKGTELTCAECGENPGISVYCQNCHAIYPDFYVTESSSAAKKQFGRIFSIFNKGSKLSAKTASTSQYTDFGIKSQETKGGFNLPGQPAQVKAIFAIIVIAAVVGGFLWYRDRVETKYAEKYVRALYSIKSAADLDNKVATRISTDWKASMAANAPQPSKEEIIYMARASKDVETTVKNIGEAPKKFIPSHENIIKLHTTYTNLHAFMAKPSGSMDSYASTTKRLDDEFRENSKALKSGLPEKIVNTISTSKKKYKALQDF